MRELVLKKLEELKKMSRERDWRGVSDWDRGNHTGKIECLEGLLTTN